MPQPVVGADSGDVLCFNGQIFEGIPDLSVEGSDTEALWSLLQEANGDPDRIRAVFGGRAEGPYVDDCDQLWLSPHVALIIT